MKNKTGIAVALGIIILVLIITIVFLVAGNIAGMINKAPSGFLETVREEREETLSNDSENNDFFSENKVEQTTGENESEETQSIPGKKKK